MRLVEIVQSCCSDEPVDPAATIVWGALPVGMFPVDRLQQVRCLEHAKWWELDSRIEMPVKAAISLKTTITGMKRMEESTVRFLIRCGSALTISALVRR